MRAGQTLLFSFSYARESPAVLPPLEQIPQRIDACVEWWRRWAGQGQYDGDFREAVLRSALTLKLLTFTPLAPSLRLRPLPFRSTLVAASVIDAAAQYAFHGGVLDRETQKALIGFGNYVVKHWQLPDQGIWEFRTDPRHHTHSRLLCWTALDRLVTLGDQEISRTDPQPDCWPRLE